jgi:hypothetical protein
VGAFAGQHTGQRAASGDFTAVSSDDPFTAHAAKIERCGIGKKDLEVPVYDQHRINDRVQNTVHGLYLIKNHCFPHVSHTTSKIICHSGLDPGPSVSFIRVIRGYLLFPGYIGLAINHSLISVFLNSFPT